MSGRLKIYNASTSQWDYVGLTESGVFTTWNPNPTGFSGSPIVVATYTVIGKLRICYLHILGTSNATSFTFSLPDTAKQTNDFKFRVIDNGATYSLGVGKVTAGNTSVSVYKDLSGSAFTATNNKGIYYQTFMYEAA